MGDVTPERLQSLYRILDELGPFSRSTCKECLDAIAGMNRESRIKIDETPMPPALQQAIEAKLIRAELQRAFVLYSAVEDPAARLFGKALCEIDRLESDNAALRARLAAAERVVPLDTTNHGE